MRGASGACTAGTSAGVYLLPLLGGFLADRVLGFTAR